MQNDVPDNLKLSRDTTIKVIDNMESVIVSKGERRGQGHRLLIEDKTQFNRIHAELSEIETIIDSMSESMKKFKSISGFDLKSISQVSDRRILKKLANKFVYPYLGSFGYILETLLVLTTNNIQSQKDAWTIYKKIIELKIKLEKQYWSLGDEGGGSLLNYATMIHVSSEDLQKINQQEREYAEKYEIPINQLTPNLLSKIQNFEAKFFPSYPK
jgi:hypothetical protein